MSKLFLIAALLGPAIALAADVHAKPDQVVLGRDHRVEIVVSQPEVIGSASAGRLSEPVARSGETDFVWTPPESGSPRTAVLLFWAQAADRADVSVLRIPMAGRTELGIDTEPNAEVRVTIAGNTFGPRRANGAGKVRVPVEVPPGAKSASVAAESHGRVKERQVPLELPPDVGFALAAGPEPLARDERGWALVVAGDPAGRVPDLHAKGAEVSSEGGGAARAEYSLHPTPGATKVELSATRRNERHHFALSITAHPAPKPHVETARAARPFGFDAFAQVGGFLSSGANDGYAIAIGAGLGPFLDGHLFAELSVGLRHTGYTRALPGIGTLHSSVSGFPIELSGRAPLIALGPVQLEARAGGGLVPFHHAISSDFEPGFSESGLGWELFGAVDASLPLGRFTPFFEIAAAVAPIHTDRLDASLGGVRFLLGGRFAP